MASSPPLGGDGNVSVGLIHHVIQDRVPGGILGGVECSIAMIIAEILHAEKVFDPLCMIIFGAMRFLDEI